MSKAAALEALRSIKKEARSMMAERMAARRKKRAGGISDGISAEENPEDQLQVDSRDADPDDKAGDDGFDEEYPRDDVHDDHGADDNDMADEELPSIIIHNGSRSHPIMPRGLHVMPDGTKMDGIATTKRGRGRPRKG